MNKVDLGPALNYLLDRDTRLRIDHEGALQLPEPGNRGGNMAVVAIAGRPGSGKSTLALQMVTRAAKAGFDSLYLSLEDHPETIKKKAKIFEWDSMIYIPNRATHILAESEARAAEERIEFTIQSARTSAKPKQGAVIVASLLPRPIDISNERATQFFHEQYGYLEKIVKGAAAHASQRENRSIKKGIRVVVIDSLNMLNYTGQSRESFYRIFDLFRAHGIMGVFTVDANSATPFDSTMADVVFAFSSKSDASYLINYLSIEKSRYTPTAFGLHPYKISPKDGIYVLPSLHAVVAATSDDSQEKPRATSQRRSGGEFPFGWGPDLTRYVARSTLKRPGVVALHGPHGTRKSTIAANFLIHGLIGEGGKKIPNESGILIRLEDAGEITSFAELQTYLKMNKDLQQRLEHCKSGALVDAMRNYKRGTKAAIKVWGIDGKTEGSVLVIIDLNTGMLLPEEFVDIVRGVHQTLKTHFKKVRRVALDDVSTIGSGSFPLLQRSETTADLFLSAFVHLMRNERVDLLLLGTRGQLESSNRLVDQAIALADAVIETKVRDIFGDRYVLLSGDGSMAQDAASQEWVPPALQIVGKKVKSMVFDPTLLRGLTGFDGTTITRTKVFAYLYEENEEIHGRYNRTLPYLLEPLCGLPDTKGTSGLQVISFDPDISDTIHRTVDVVHSPQDQTNSLRPPKEHTVLAMIDEFERRFVTTDQRGSKAYINNVLLVAWRNDLLRKKVGAPPWKTWSDLLQFANSFPEDALKRAKLTRFWIDRTARETLSCCLVDCLLCGWNLGTEDRRPISNYWPELLRDLEGNPVSTRKSTVIVEQANAMHNLLYHAKSSLAWARQAPPFATHGGVVAPELRRRPKSQVLRDGLPEDAAVYICWYSQLRHLLARCHRLAGKFQVAALPGRGFKGDWNLLVLPGSVSHTLGDEVVGALTTSDEDYRRFQQGVGLPVDPRWRESAFRAWPGANAQVTLKKVYGIHRQARRRSEIAGYAKITRVLSTFAKRLAGDWTEGGPMPIDIIQEHLRRMPDHFATVERKAR